MENGKKFYKLDKTAQILKQNAESMLYHAVINHDVLDSYMNRTHFNSLLDVGCGDGHFIKKFPNINAMGIDLNQSMLDQAVGLEGKLKNVDLLSDKTFIKTNYGKFDIVTSNYVFTEFKKKDLISAFKNIHELLQDGGVLYFTITDPRTRDRKEFPGYKLIFEEKYEYEKQDLPFKVLLQSSSGFVDVGIRDYHQPIELYDHILDKIGFRKIKRKDIDIGHDCSYAVLYCAIK